MGFNFDLLAEHVVFICFFGCFCKFDSAGSLYFPPEQIKRMWRKPS